MMVRVFDWSTDPQQWGTVLAWDYALNITNSRGGGSELPQISLQNVTSDIGRVSSGV